MSDKTLNYVTLLEIFVALLYVFLYVQVYVQYNTILFGNIHN